MIRHLDRNLFKRNCLPLSLDEKTFDATTPISKTQFNKIIKKHHPIWLSAVQAFNAKKDMKKAAATATKSAGTPVKSKPGAVRAVKTGRNKAHGKMGKKTSMKHQASNGSPTQQINELKFQEILRNVSEELAKATKSKVCRG